MRFGTILPQFGGLAAGADVAGRIARIATAADRLGYDVLWTAEHFIYPYEIKTPYPYGKFPFPVTEPWLDVVSTLSYVAALTKRIRLSSQVLVLPYHQPVVLAKELATLDVLSGGRVVVGVASGWLAEEFAMLGVTYRERGKRMDEYLDVLHALWTTDHVTFRGRFVQLEDAAFFPKPVQKPRPPIWVGGGKGAAFPRIARIADGWIPAPGAGLDALAGDVRELRTLVEQAGRDPDRIDVALGGAARSVDELLARVPELERAGVTTVTVPTLFWGKSFAHALELLEEFAMRAGLARAA